MSSQQEKVWVPDEREVFLQGQLVEQKVVKNKQGQDQNLSVVRVNGKDVEFPADDVVPINPSTFDKVDDLSELTHLNEASVLFNLENRYHDGLIYTYSGLFLVAINPYSNIKIYNNDYIKLYHGSPKEDNKPHIFAVAEQAYQNLLHQKQDQSILVTGESGAGKTENTKKILQYLASITTDDKLILHQTNESFERKILQSNPILESFGNAQTVRNNNSSRFGKFIKIDFDEYGKINGAHIEWYLLEKSRVIHAHSKERNYHIFYQILSGMSKQELRSIELDSNSILDYQYLRHSNPSIPGVNDASNYQELLSAFEVVGFKKEEVQSILKCVALILHIGNVEFVSERSEQATIKNDISSLCKLLGVSEKEFKRAVLNPKSKAGKEWVSQAKNAAQARSILNSLARSLYEKLFEYIVNQINKSLEHGSMTEYFIGLLDIAGFEIFKDNSFEQLCINYTNEKLQQFFNHHMFVLEQNEYLKENIQWNFVDYGKDLQSTIDLIEEKTPIPGILPILEEESILPKSSDQSFYSKLLASWEKNSTKFKRSKLDNCFILKHYAADVEYNVSGWLSKNRDPLNENLLQVLNDCSNPLVSQFFADQSRGNSFRTSSTKHREQLHFLIEQLEKTDPHFVRCIIPNTKKKANDFDKRLILEQLRCNGVLEGIRIARDGYPNRIFFKEFFQRYKILSDEYRFTTTSKKNCEIILSSLHLDPSIYKVGNTKLFFKAGVLANLEQLKEQRLCSAVTQFNSVVSGGFVRKSTKEHLKKLQAARVLKVALETHDRLMENPWYNLYMKLLPLLQSSDDIVKTKKIAEKVKLLERELLSSEQDRSKLEQAKRVVDEELLKVRSILNKESEELRRAQKSLEETKANQEDLQAKWNEALKLEASVGERNHDLSDELKSLRNKFEETSNSLSISRQTCESLSKEKESLSQKVQELSSLMDDRTKEAQILRSEKELLNEEIQALKREILEKGNMVKNMEAKLHDSELSIDIKLKSLEKHLAITSKRMKGFVEENTELNAQLETMKRDLSTKTKLLESKSKELENVNERASRQSTEVNAISKEKESLIDKVSSLSQELKNLRSENEINKKKVETLTSRLEEATSSRYAVSSTNDTEEVVSLRNKLSQEQSMNTFLNERLLSVGRSGKTVHGFSAGINPDDLHKEFDNLSMKYKQIEQQLETEIEDKKTLISRLRFAETRLASASFENQTIAAQLNKIKQLSKSTLEGIDLDKELQNVNGFELNQEKMLMEVDFLKKQLTKEVEARKDAERVAVLLHQKVGQIQRSDSTADIYKLRYEAKEDYVKSLETRLDNSPLKDKTNTVNGDIFKHRESFEKYEEELQRFRVEYNRVQSMVSDYSNKLQEVTLRYNKGLVTEASLREQVAHLEDELKTVENQKNMVQSNSKRYQAQYEESQRDLVAVESEVRAVKHGLKQAEKDIESMTQMIQKLRSQNKQKEQEIWKQETKLTELESLLDERTIELDKCVAKNKSMEEDLAHYKDRAKAVENNKEYLAEIDSLKGQLDVYLRLETEMKKEISNLTYQLETLKLDTDAKIDDLLKQVQHYENAISELGIQKDEAEADKKSLETAIKTLTVKITSLEEQTYSLSKENDQLQQERQFLRTRLDEAGQKFGQSVKEKEKYSHDVQFLEESLALQKQQTERNEELFVNLQRELSELKTSLSAEKDKCASLFQENSTLGKANELLKKDLKDAKHKLADTSEKDAWFKKIQSIEKDLEEQRTSKFDEIKKSKRLERIVEELERKNEEQAKVIEMANDAKYQYEQAIGNLDEKLGDIEASVASKDAALTSLYRDNTYYKDQISELQKEIESWKHRYEKLSERKQSLVESTDAVFI